MTLTRAQIVTAARGWIGTPYRHQASLKGIGTDCLGLVRGVWREVLGEEPERPPAYGAGWLECRGELLAEAARRHMQDIPCTDFDAGDMLLFRWRSGLPARHAGIATDRGHMVHAQEGAAAVEVPLNAWWRRHLAHAFRFPGLAC
jgi:NlpC/P60 family putative phage cell wall peptidase